MDEDAGTFEGLKRADAQSYDAMATDFDILTDRYSTAIASRLLAIANVKFSDKMLDLGTGTGLVARLAAERGASVVGIDHSEGMLARARYKADEAALGSLISFESMDAEAMRFADASFDVVSSLYVLRHLPNPQKAIHEMSRILRPGGRLVVAVGARPSAFSLGAVLSGLGAMADRTLASVGRAALSPGFLREFLDEEGVPPNRSHAGHHGNEGVSHMFAAAGLSNIRREWWGKRYALPVEEFWDVQAVLDSEARQRLMNLPGDRVNELKGRFLKRCRALSNKGVTFIYRTGAEIYSAVR